MKTFHIESQEEARAALKAVYDFCALNDIPALSVMRREKDVVSYYAYGEMTDLVNMVCEGIGKHYVAFAKEMMKEQAALTFFCEDVNRCTREKRRI